MADEFTTTNDLGPKGEQPEEERDLTEEPLTDEEQGNQDINKEKPEDGEQPTE